MQAAESPSNLEQAETVEQLGKYRLIAVLGHGGMGDVYLAVAQGPIGFNKLLVVKELRHRALEDPAQVMMFMDEARLTGRLNHPNVVQTIEVGEDGPRRFIAMEYLDGQPLSRILLQAKKRGTPVPRSMLFRVVLDVLTALDYAHRLADFDGTPLQVVHRDVSPQNIFVTYEGQVKLIDFGVAKTAISEHETSSGILKGKIRYMAPEQATGQPIDRRADIFAAGVLLWEAAAGAGPWVDAQDASVLRGLMTGVIPRLRAVRPDVDTEIASIVDRAMSAEPAARFPTASAMRDALERFVSGRSGQRGSQRDLSAFVSLLFADDRRTLRTLVDSQLRIVNEQRTLEVVSLTGMRGGRDTLPPSSGRAPVSSTQPAIHVPPPPQEDAEPTQLETPRPVRPLLLAAGGIAALLAAALVGGVAVLRWLPLHTDAAMAANALRAPTPAAPALARNIHSAHVTVNVTPRTAALFVDDVPVPNPYVADRPADGLPHRLRAEAPGFDSREWQFTLEGDAEFDVSLDRAGAPPALGRRPAPGRGAAAGIAGGTSPGDGIPAPRPQAPARAGDGLLSSGMMPAAAPGTSPPRPKRDLDRANPYAP
jgi:serine/threonine protein kinase